MTLAMKAYFVTAYFALTAPPFVCAVCVVRLFVAGASADRCFWAMVIAAGAHLVVRAVVSAKPQQS